MTNLNRIFKRWKRSLAKKNSKKLYELLAINLQPSTEEGCRLIVSERFFFSICLILATLQSWQNPFPVPYFKGRILLKRFGFLQMLTCSISFLCRDQATSGAQEKLQTEGGARKNLSLSRHSSVNDVIKSAKCVGLGPRTTNTFYMSIWQPRNPGYWNTQCIKHTLVSRNIGVLKLICENERTSLDTLVDKKGQEPGLREKQG